MPFITEEIWHLIKDRSDRDCIIVAEWPKVNKTSADLSIIAFFAVDQRVISAIREFRNKKGISPKEKLELYYKGSNKDDRFEEVVKKMANLSAIKKVNETVPNAHSFVEDVEYFIPIVNMNVDAEKERLAKELEYNKGFLKSVQVKLANEKFMANAKPELIANERKKQADAEAKIKAIEEQIANLS